MRTILAQNANARIGDDDLGDALQVLLDAGWHIDRLQATSREATIRELRERSNDLDVILVAGGDGTLNTVVQAAAHSHLAVGIFPMGTANDFARSLDLPLSPREAAIAMLGESSHLVDLGEVNGHYFVNAIGFGLGSKITEELGAELKARWGVLGYAIALARAWKKSRPFTAIIEGPAPPLKRRLLQVTIGNGPHYGGGMTVAEGATLDDGLLDMQAIEPATLRELMLHARALRHGRAWEPPFVEIYSGREFRIATSPVLAVSVDGDLLTNTPISCVMHSRALRVLGVGTSNEGLSPPSP